MNLALCIKCWVFPFTLKMPQLPLIRVIFVSPFLAKYLSTAFLPRLLITIGIKGPILQGSQHPRAGGSAPYGIRLTLLQHLSAPSPSGPSTSAHTTSSPRRRIPTLAQAGRYLPGVFCYLCNLHEHLRTR